MSDRGTFSGRPGGSAATPTGVPSLPPGLLSPSGLVAPAVAPAPVTDAPSSPGAPPSPEKALGPAFAGTPARPGARLAAFSIDVAAVAVVTAIVGILTGSILLGVVTAIELAIALWVVESRTGLTLGNALLRLRASREDAPFSPGVGQGFVRFFLTGAGFLAAIVGAWVVVASSAWDRSGRGRTWADRAAGTVVVAAPARVRSEVRPADGIRFAAPQIVSTTMRAVVDDDAASILAPSTNLSEVTGDGTSPAGPAPAVSRDSGSVVAAYLQQAPEPVEAGALLLIFDTGQREQLPIPVAVNLGRNPSETQPGDRLISVSDPDSTVSRTHLRLEHSRGRTWVTDNASTNGTEIRSDDGQAAPLQPGNRILLDEGDRVRIGNRTFTISVLLPHELGAAGGAR